MIFLIAPFVEHTSGHVFPPSLPPFLYLQAVSPTTTAVTPWPQAGLSARTPLPWRAVGRCRQAGWAATTRAGWLPPPAARWTTLPKCAPCTRG